MLYQTALGGITIFEPNLQPGPRMLPRVAMQLDIEGVTLSEEGAKYLNQVAASIKPVIVSVIDITSTGQSGKGIRLAVVIQLDPAEPNAWKQAHDCAQRYVEHLRNSLARLEQKSPDTLETFLEPVRKPLGERVLAALAFDPLATGEHPGGYNSPQRD